MLVLLLVLLSRTWTISIISSAYWMERCGQLVCWYGCGCGCDCVSECIFWVFSGVENTTQAEAEAEQPPLELLQA